MGSRHRDLIGPDITDGSGQKHLGITNIPIPVLSAGNAVLIDLVRMSVESGLELVSFSKIAQSIHTYQEYEIQLRLMRAEMIEYSGIDLYGDKKTINSLVGSLPKLR